MGCLCTCTRYLTYSTNLPSLSLTERIFIFTFNECNISAFWQLQFIQNIRDKQYPSFYTHCVTIIENLLEFTGHSCGSCVTYREGTSMQYCVLNFIFSVADFCYVAKYIVLSSHIIIGYTV